MCYQNIVKLTALFAVAAVLGGCGAMDTILPSTGTYKVSAQVNGLNMDNCSFAGSNDTIMPYFEESVSNDPDITALVVFLKDSSGEPTGVKVSYNIDENYVESGEDLDYGDTGDDSAQEAAASGENTGSEAADDAKEAVSEKIVKTKKKGKYQIGDEIDIPVKNFDKKLPAYPLPEDLPMGLYTIVYQVMGGKQILQKTEKIFFHLANTVFSFDGVQIHLPGVAEGAQLIQKGSVIMLETKLNFDSRLDPYIIWYNGKSIISEGSLSEGAGSILWKAPEQSGFFSLRVEVLPVFQHHGLAGFSRDVPLFVSSKTSGMHLFSKDLPGLMHLYLFEGNLNDSITAASSELLIKNYAGSAPKWLPSDGVYALASGTGDVYALPKVSFSNGENNNWRILFRFKPVDKGDIFSVQFGSSPGVAMNLTTEGKKLVLSLSSSGEPVSQSIELPDPGRFIAGGVDFSLQHSQLSARLSLLEDLNNQKRPVTKQINLNTEDDYIYQITLGSLTSADAAAASASSADDKNGKAVQKKTFTALWDEIALINIPLAGANTESEDESPDNEEYFETYDELALEN